MIEGGGKVSREIRDQAKSNWFCFFSNMRNEPNPTLIKEILFWAYIDHGKDTLAHIILPQNPRRDFWRRHFSVDAFPTIVLSDDAEYPDNYIIFPPSFLYQEVFKDPNKLIAVLDFYHDKIVDGYTFDNLKKKKVLEELSELTKIALKQLKDVLSISAAVLK